MPKKTTKTETVVEVEEPQTATEIPVESTIEIDELDDLESALESFGPAGGVFKIEKYIEGIKQHCGRVDPSVLKEEGEDFILKKWGGGRYRIIGMREGRFVKGTCRVFDIYTAPQTKAEVFSERIQPSVSNTETMLLVKKSKDSMSLF